MSWTDERIDKLKLMWEKGMTASQIAEELGGVSRNAVIGKAHRLDLQSRPSPVKANDDDKSGTKKAAAPKAPKPAPRPVEAAPPRAEPVIARTPPPAPAVAAPTPVPVPTSPHAPTGAQLRSIGPWGFLR
jgi:GcrA cell cycle regulator